MEQGYSQLVSSRLAFVTGDPASRQKEGTETPEIVKRFLVTCFFFPGYAIIFYLKVENLSLQVMVEVHSLSL